MGHSFKSLGLSRGPSRHRTHFLTLQSLFSSKIVKAFFQVQQQYHVVDLGKIGSVWLAERLSWAVHGGAWCCWASLAEHGCLCKGGAWGVGGGELSVFNSCKNGV